jgi:transcriptional regulator with XRE-family HTH domain
MDDHEMGRRIASWRRRRKLTQAVFAGRLGRSKSWVEKVENGTRSATRSAVFDRICSVLQVDAYVLASADPARRPSACLDDCEVEGIRETLERHPYRQHAAVGPSLEAVRRQLDHVWDAFEFGNYQIMGIVLPDLLADAQQAHTELGSAESARLLADAYQVISSTLRKLGEYSLAWLAADRGISAGQQAGSLALAAGAEHRAANALLSMGRPAQALDQYLSLASRLQPECRSEGMRALYGHVTLQAAMAAAGLGDQAKADALLTEAADVAQSVRAGSNYYRLAFCMVNVILHEVAALVALGENGRAVEVANMINGAELRTLRKERRATLLVDTARACCQAGRPEEALRRLLVAEDIAPAEVRCRPVAQIVIAELLRRSQGAPPVPLLLLAGRARVRP